jgi:integrase
MRFLTNEEVRALADAIDPRYRVLVLAGAYTGLRIGELAGLKLDALDMLRRRLTVTRSVNEVRGKLVVRSEPKTAASRRTVALPRFLVDELAAHLALVKDPDGWVFPAPDGGPLRRNGFRSRFWQTAVSRAGLAGVRIHDLRHTHAAWLIAQGEHPKVIQARLGHASIKTTLDVYGHLFDGLDEKAASRLDSLVVQNRQAYS